MDNEQNKALTVRALVNGVPFSSLRTEDRDSLERRVASGELKISFSEGKGKIIRFNYTHFILAFAIPLINLLFILTKF